MYHNIGNILTTPAQTKQKRRERDVPCDQAFIQQASSHSRRQRQKVLTTMHPKPTMYKQSQGRVTLPGRRSRKQQASPPNSAPLIVHSHILMALFLPSAHAEGNQGAQTDVR